MQTHLTQRLKKRELDSEALGLLHERIKNRWPAYRRLAVLGAYREQPNGIPWSRAPYWYYGYGLTLCKLGRYEEAREAAREGIRRLQESGSSMEGALVDMQGVAEAALGFLKEAETSFRRALGISEKTFGPDHLDVALRYNHLAGLYLNQGRDAEVEPLCQRALGIWEKTRGPDHPAMATVFENYAALLRELDRITEAESMETRAQAIQKRLASQK